MCYEEVVLEMNILVEDDDVEVEKSPKNYENGEATKEREKSHREVSGRELGVGL
jgi:hypothetical protein